MQEYRFKFYLNAMHSIEIEGIKGELHPHTWEITVDVFKQKNSFITFSEVEKMVDELLVPFQDKNMNTISPFDAINPTLENVSLHMQEILETLFIQNGFIMSRIEVSETPSRTFIIDIKNDMLKRPEIIDKTTGDIKVIESEADKLFQKKASKLGVTLPIENPINQSNDIVISNEKNEDNYSYERTKEIAKIIDTDKESVLKRSVRKSNNMIWYIFVFIIFIFVFAILFYLKG